MNNKGFAITGVLYSLLILFLVVLLSLLAALRTENSRFVMLKEAIEDDYRLSDMCEMPEKIELGGDSSLVYYITESKKYYLEVTYDDDSFCGDGFIYVPENVFLQLNGGKLAFSTYAFDGDVYQIKGILGCTDTSSIRRVTLVGYGCNKEGE